MMENQVICMLAVILNWVKNILFEKIATLLFFRNILPKYIKSSESFLLKKILHESIFYDIEAYTNSFILDTGTFYETLMRSD